ncbi:MAG: hypothetical protein JO271_08605, partial [Verrucomicrobia bacterium]|nr:hypothetical protein [Verrucomicrobiota bacterium]
MESLSLIGRTKRKGWGLFGIAIAVLTITGVLPGLSQMRNGQQLVKA